MTDTPWKTMDSAPTDGTHLLLAVKYPSGFVYTVQGCCDPITKTWSTAAMGCAQPIMWMKNIPLPDGWEKLT